MLSRSGYIRYDISMHVCTLFHYERKKTIEVGVELTRESLVLTKRKHALKRLMPVLRPRKMLRSTEAEDS